MLCRICYDNLVCLSSALSPNQMKGLRKYLVTITKVLAAVLIVFSAPFLAPPLVVASAIALISSLPYFVFLASYVCTEKLMRKLLPATAFSGRGEKMVLLGDKIGIYDDRMAPMAKPMSELTFVQTDEEEGTAAIAFKEDDRAPLIRVTNIVFDVYQTSEHMRKDSKRLLDSIRDDDRTNQSLDRGIAKNDLKEDNGEYITNMPEKVGAGAEDLSRKKKVIRTTHEGGLESSTKEASRGKYMEEFSNEMKVLCSEEQIWAKMETLRKIVGYSVARSTTYSEELKAVYMFTGVELPTSLLEKENQDIAHVSESLYFLMSVIGTK